LGGMTANLTGQVAVSTLVQTIKAINCNSSACSDYQQFYSSFMSIVITLFSLSGISIFYFWQQHEERRTRYDAIRRMQPAKGITEQKEKLVSDLNDDFKKAIETVKEIEAQSKQENPSPIKSNSDLDALLMLADRMCCPKCGKKARLVLKWSCCGLSIDKSRISNYHQR
jgi:hypothetical protein